MPYHVLLADDEQIIREGLPYLVDWEELDCTITYKAKNGEDAINYLSSHRNEINIVITDIKMPEKDGLEVSRYVKEHCPFVQVIILTAYTEFAFAQQAIRYEVSDLLIKNDIAQTLPQAIRKAQASLQAKWKESLALKTANSTIKRRRETEFETTMRNAINGLDEHPLQEDKEPFCVAIYEIYEPEFSVSSALDDEICALLSFAFLPHHSVTAELSRRVFCTMVMDLKDKKVLRSLFDQLKAKLAAHSLLLLVGVSEVHFRTQELFQTTLEALHRVNKLCSDQVWYMDQDQESGECEDRNLKKLLQIQNLEKYFRDLQTYCDSSIPFDSLKLDMMKLLTILSSTYKPFSDEHEDTLYVKEIQKTQCRWRLQQIIISYASCCQQTPLTRMEVSNPLIREVLTYICQNYYKQINLQSIANTYHLSDSYLSRLFHRHTGKSLVHLLNEQRIEAAKRLLDDPKLKIFEISDLVGIPDSTYFSRLFLKHTKMSPTEYRNRTEQDKIIQ